MDYHKHLFNAIVIVEERIDSWIKNPIFPAISVNGNASLGTDEGSTIDIGTNSTNVLNVKAQTFFYSDVTIHNDDDDLVLTTDSLTVHNDTHIGQDSSDTLYVNSDTKILNDIEISGTTNADEINATGIITAPQFTLTPTNENQINVGTLPIIQYIEISSETNIYNDFPHAVVLVVKNISTIATTIIYDLTDSSLILNTMTQAVFIKTSLTGFARII